MGARTKLKKKIPRYSFLGKTNIHSTSAPLKRFRLEGISRFF